MARDTPELSKLAAVADDAQIIGEFLDSSPYTLCETVPCEKHHLNPRAVNFCSQGEHLVPTIKTIQQILAEYYSIDLQEVERERREILRETQEATHSL